MEPWSNIRDFFQKLKKKLTDPKSFKQQCVLFCAPQKKVIYARSNMGVSKLFLVLNVYVILIPTEEAHEHVMYVLRNLPFVCMQIVCIEKVP